MTSEELEQKLHKLEDEFFSAVYELQYDGRDKVRNIFYMYARTPYNGTAPYYTNRYMTARFKDSHDGYTMLDGLRQHYQRDSERNLSIDEKLQRLDKRLKELEGEIKK